MRLLERGSAEWPALLAHLGAGEPKRLHVRGPLSLDGACAAPTVAMVGARAPSAAGERFARTLARELAEAGVTVISGLALGIDAAAHAGALDGARAHGRRAGLRHRPRLPAPQRGARQRASPQPGAIVSEWGPGVEPAPWRFPVRNRIVAALAQATVVVEATRRSGALITADHALALGRDVLAVPGAPWLELGGGTLALLRRARRRSAAPATSSTPSGCRWRWSRRAASRPPGVAGVLWAELRRRPRRRDALALATGLAADVASAALAELELDGLIVEERDGTLSALEPSRRRPVNSSGRGA